MTEIERVLNKPISREEERYSMKRSDLDFLYRTAKGGQFHMAFIAFRYGFEKGLPGASRPSGGAKRRAMPSRPTGLTTWKEWRRFLMPENETERRKEHLKELVDSLDNGRDILLIYRFAKALTSKEAAHRAGE